MSAPTFRRPLRDEVIATEAMLGAVLLGTALAAGLGAFIGAG
jgi:hypothetical protein